MRTTLNDAFGYEDMVFGNTVSASLSYRKAPPLESRSCATVTLDEARSNIETHFNHPSTESVALTVGWIRNVLVVDDVAMNRKMVCQYLIWRGVRCYEVADGKEAVEKVHDLVHNQEHKVSVAPVLDMIIIDHEMPVLNGPNAVQQIR
jgi:PleD family two-component response regulator